MAEVIDDDVDLETPDETDPDVAGGDEELSAPPRRARAEIPMMRRGAASHRQAPPAAKTKVGAPSPWERPREGFTQAMGERAATSCKKATVQDAKPATERF